MLFGNHVQNGVAGLGVQVSRGFIGKQHVRIVHEGTRDSNALPLTAGELCWSVAEAVRKSKSFQQHARAVTNFPLAAHPLKPPDTNGGGQQRVLQDIQFWQQVIELKDEPNVFVAIAVKALLAVTADMLAPKGDRSGIRAIKSTKEV